MSALETTATSDGFGIRAGSASFGTNISGGDINGDGYSDLIVGDPNASGGHGAYFILNGHAGASGNTNWTNLYANDSGLFQVTGNIPLANDANTVINSSFNQGTVNDYDGNLGDHVSIIDDINGDGYKDYIVTAPYADTDGNIGATGTNAGDAYLVFGSAAGLGAGFDLNNLTSAQGIRISGTEDHETLGASTEFNGVGQNGDQVFGQSSSVNSIGDINGDGIADFAIGSPQWGDQAFDGAAAGRVYIVYGKEAGDSWSNLDLLHLDGTNGFILNSTELGGATSSINNAYTAQLGFSVSNGGDVNGDGIDDFIVGAPGAKDGANNYAGAAYLVYGQAGGSGFSSVTDLDILVTDGKAQKFTGIAASNFAGTGVSTGDWNGDGIADVAYGEWESTTGSAHGGSYRVFNGSTANLTQTFTSGDDTLVTGTHSGTGPAIVNGVDRISGGQGNDTINGIGTDTTNSTAATTLHDVALGGAGNDRIALAGLNFTRVDGGLGVDTLALTGATALHLDLATNTTRVKGFEKFDLGTSDSVGHTLSLRLADVTSQADTNTLGHIEVAGGAGDKVDLSGAGTWKWSDLKNVGGAWYDVYHNSTLDASNTKGDVWVQSGVSVNGQPEINYAAVLPNPVTAVSASIDPAAPNFTTSSNQQYDGLGWDMVNLGDFNGDGYADFYVSASHDQYGHVESGKSNQYIVYGSATGLPNLTNIELMTAAQGIVISSTNWTHVSGEWGMTGADSAALGDINGDGYADLGMTAHYNDRAYVVFGRAANTGTLDLATVENGATADGFVIKNNSTGAWFGTGIAGGDVNGDGYSDILIGSSDGGGNGSGEYFVLNGHAGTGGTEWVNLYAKDVSATDQGLYTINANGSLGTVLSNDLHSVVKTTYDVGGVGADMGEHLTVLGDVNGDGFKDYLVSGPRADIPGFAGAGRAILVFGSEAGLGSGFDLADLTAEQGIRLSGTEAYETLGHTNTIGDGSGSDADAQQGSSSPISNIGDINGDGINDFAIGSPEWGDQVSDGQAAGRVYVVYGQEAGFNWADLSLGALNGTNGFILNSTALNSNASSSNNAYHAQLGYSISTGGDVNGDGLDDFLVGAPGADLGASTYVGTAYLVYGKVGSSPFTATTDLDTLVTSGKAVKFDGVNASDFAGTGLTIGDWNGDGIDDVSFGIWESNVSATQGGSYKVYSGTTGNLTLFGTSGDDVLAAGTQGGAGTQTIVGGVDRISGGLGNDTITGIGTDTSGTMDPIATLHDVAYGGAGDDNISLAGMSFTRVDGGLGIDTLTLAGSSSLSLDFASVGTRVQGFEKFDLGASDGIGNTLSLRLSDVLNETSGSLLGHFEVKGGAGDTVQLNGSGNWAASSTMVSSGVTYDVYHNSNLDAANKLGDVWIQQGMAVL
jgi:FG-GAP repeat